jgi:uncharacterized integral membrane protein
MRSESTPRADVAPEYFCTVVSEKCLNNNNLMNTLIPRDHKRLPAFLSSLQATMPGRESMSMKMPAVIFLLLLVVIFTLQNTEQVNINFLFWHVTLSRALMLFLVLTVGLLIGWLMGTVGCRTHHPEHESESRLDKES